MAYVLSKFRFSFPKKVSNTEQIHSGLFLTSQEGFVERYPPVKPPTNAYECILEKP